MGTDLDDSACRVYLALRQRISSGELAPDKRLPSYRDLTQEFQVNEALVPSVFHRLQIDGYVYQKPGQLFWFVKPRSRIVSRREFLGNMARFGLQTVALPAAVAVFANKITLYVPDLPSVSNESTEKKRPSHIGVTSCPT